MCDKKGCTCGDKDNQTGCGCSHFDNATGKEKLKALVDKGKTLFDKGKEFAAGLQAGGASQPIYVVPPTDKKDNTMMYVGIGIAVVVVIIIIVVIIKKRGKK